jgi:CRISPR-associated protein Cmr5
MTPQEEKVSQQRSLEQERAKFAWKCIGKVPKDNQKEYAALAKGAPADIQINGLGQTLAFWRAKGYENGKPKENAHCNIYHDVSEWLGGKDRFNVERKMENVEYMDKDGRKRTKKIEKWILNWIMDIANVDAYRRATSESIAFLIWLKKFAEAEFGGKESE